jgi:uncharacterized protein YifE (UPF0438 family)
MCFTIKTILEVFSPEEIQILERHGRGLERLMKGELPVNTVDREHFIQVCAKRAQPQTIYEKVWRKYLDRLEWESDPANRAAMSPRRHATEGFGGTREDFRNMHRAESADFWRRQRE